MRVQFWGLVNLTTVSLLCSRCEMANGRSKLRLPTSLSPVHYWLKLLPTFENEGFQTTGRIRIHLRCEDTTDEVLFNIMEIDIDEGSVYLEKVNGSKLSIVSQKEDREIQMYRMQLATNLEPGSEYMLEMNFSYVLNSHLQGFYKSSYKDKQGKTKWLASTQFSPIDARRAFPCWDEPSFKAVFTISLGRHKTMSSLSNMPLASTEPMSNKKDWVWDHYEKTLRMSTYLIAFIVSDLSHRDISKTTTPHFKIWSRSDLLSQMEYLGDLCPRILSFIVEYFGIPFPLSKIDLFAVPEFGFAAMENWGLITFAESAINRSSVVAHELAHQWFGNLVTPEWWEDLWLKEGFATFIGLRALSHVEAESKPLDRWIIDELHNSLFQDSFLTSHPVSNPVEDPRMIWQAFDTISYQKGASVIRMMCEFMGEEKFRQGLGVYLKKYAFNNARREQLWNSLSLVTKENIGLIMDTWTLQTGYPVITCSRNYKSRSVTLSQKRFLLSGKQDEKSSWIVPVSYLTKQDVLNNRKNSVKWLKSSELILNLDDLLEKDWLLININNTGFYRVNYDIQNWYLLVADFESLSHLTQAQLLNDGFNLAMAGLLTYHIPLAMTDHLKSIHDSLIWNTTTTELFKLDTLLHGTDIDVIFKEYMLSLIPSLPFDFNVPTSNLKFVKFALKMGHPVLVRRAVELVKKLMIGKGIILNEDIKCDIYCAGVKYGDADMWEFLWEQFIKERNPKQRNAFLQGVACSKDPKIIQRLLKALLSDDSGVRKEDARLLFSCIANNEFGTDIALEFLIENWRKCIKRYGLGFKIVSSMVNSLGPNLKKDKQLKKFQRLYDDNINDLGSTSNAFHTTIEHIEININWLNSHYDDIKQWLQNKNSVQ